MTCIIFKQLKNVFYVENIRGQTMALITPLSCHINMMNYNKKKKKAYHVGYILKFSN